MPDFRTDLVRLVTEDDLSAIALMAQRLGVNEDAIRAALEDLVASGHLRGRISGDGSRFFRSDIRTASKPVISREDTIPDFMKYDTRPGKIIAVIGLCILIGGYLAMVTAGGEISIENWGMGTMLIGVVIMMLGCYQIGRRETPS